VRVCKQEVASILSLREAHLPKVGRLSHRLYGCRMGITAEKTRKQTKHQQRSHATYCALLEAGSRIFARDGFEASRIEDIAYATGHTRGAFYAHFNNKEDLFFALFEQEAGKLLRELRIVLEHSSGDRVRALRNSYVARVSDRQWIMLSLEFKLFALRHPKLRARLARTHRRIRASLKLPTATLLPELMTTGRESRDVRRVALEAVLYGVVLEHNYDPQIISKTQATVVLGLLFDALVSAKEPSTNGPPARTRARLAQVSRASVGKLFPQM
jgi:AcrR family transcriptional regulator